MIRDSNGNVRFPGLYRGIVADNRDPLGKNRVKLTVPQVLFTTTTDWAWSQNTHGVAPVTPDIGQGVWVMFEGGDPSYPVWTGTYGTTSTKSGNTLEMLSDVDVEARTDNDLLIYNGFTGAWENGALPTGYVTNTMILPGTIANDKLAHPSLTINGVSVALGAAATILAAPTANSVTTATILDGNVTNAKLANSSLTVNGVLVSLGGSATVTATPTAGSVTTASVAPAGIASTSITNFDATIKAYRLDQFAAPTAAVSLNGQKVTNLAAPTADTDAATKAYADSIFQGLDIKPSVRVATTGANITLSGTQTIDGIAIVAGDRVLVKDQTTASQNGVYVVAAGAWTRATDASSNATVTSGMYAFVSVGTQNASTGFVLTTPDPITVGTTALTFVQFSGAGQIIAGSGLSKSGNTLSVVGTANRVTVSGTAVDIASNYVGQTSITTLGTVTVGTWNGTTIAVPNGGTGAATLTGYVKGNGAAAMTAVATIPATDVTGLSAVSMMPGSIIMYASTATPAGYLLCQGQAVSRTTYAALFAVVNTAYGAGDGSTTFNVPNLLGRFPVMLNAAETEWSAIGQVGGEKTHTLTLAESPAHAHNFTYTGSPGTPFPQWALANSAYPGSGSVSFTQSTPATSAKIGIDSQGGGTAHNNLPPYFSLNFLIKT